MQYDRDHICVDSMKIEWNQLFIIKQLKYLIDKWAKVVQTPSHQLKRKAFQWWLNKMGKKESTMKVTHKTCLHTIPAELNMSNVWKHNGNGDDGNTHTHKQSHCGCLATLNPEWDKKRVCRKFIYKCFCQLFIDPYKKNCLSSTSNVSACVRVCFVLYVCVCLLFVYTHQPRWLNIMPKT